MESFLEWFQIIIEPRLESTEMQTKLISSLAIIIAVWLLRLIVIWVIDYETRDIHVRYQWKKSLSYLLAVIGLILVGRLWITGIQSVATYFGLVSAGLAIALQAPLTNLAGWLFILWRRPFEVGDRVQVRNHAGDVIDIRLFQFTMLEIGNWVDADQSTGRIVHIPNRYLCGVRRRRSTTQSIWEDTLRAFAQHEDIQFAYPTQRFYSPDNRQPPEMVTYVKNDDLRKKANLIDNHTTN